MPIELTKAQSDAVNFDGNILVAAAAGSGKTAVLVERVVKKLCDSENPISADRLLIVTFTNAAAAEMRSRIEKRLDEECCRNPHNTALFMQKYLLSSAKICTIDSFCIDLVRENFEVLDISPDFTMVDASSLKTVYTSVISEIIGEFLEKKDPQFAELLDLVGSEYDEKDFAEFVINLYEYSRQLPDPDNWYDYLCSLYSEGKFRGDNYWVDYALNKALNTAVTLKEMLVRAVDLIGVDSKIADKFMPVFVEAGNILQRLFDTAVTKDWDKVYYCLKDLYFPSLPKVNGSNDIPEIKSAKEIYSYIRSEATENLYELFYGDSAFLDAQFKKIYPLVSLLRDILKEFDKRVFEELKTENIFTFHNTEALALKLLTGENANEFLDLYDEVCVDEYQDTNDLQNMLFYVLSNRDSRLFAVGDVKQSIYGFRGANPSHFLDKKRSHIEVDKAEAGDPIKIILGNNFRSRPEVCDFINYFFKLFMTEKTGEIVYDEEEMLIPSGNFSPTDFPKVSVSIIETKDSEEKNKVIEARQIAEFIKTVMSSGDVISDKSGGLRKARYSDFAILLRSLKNNADIITEELRRQGIPVNYSKEGFCDFTEVAVMLSLLKVIDNPTNDVELLSVLMSPIFGFSSEEMANIRINCKEGNIYSAVISASHNGNEKAVRFLECIQKYRLLAVTLSVPALIETLLEETDYLNTVLAYPDGERRKNNLLLLIDYAQSYASSSKSSVGGFVDYIFEKSEMGIKSAASVGNDDTVKIMTIHGSKGLQFPVCIIANTSAKFNGTDSRNNNIYSVKHGIGFKYYDEVAKTRYTTISREVIKDIGRRERLEEELRLFYVALTRTKDILYITGTVSSAEKKSAEILNNLIGAGSEISADIWQNTSSYLDWLMMSLMLHPDGKELRGNGTSLMCAETESRVNLKIIDGGSIPDLGDTSEEEFAEENSFITDKLLNNFKYEYPFKELLSLSSKTSVSALSHKAQSEEFDFTSKPAFLSKDGISSAGKGTAMHKVMEFFDFSKCLTPETELKRLLEWQYISQTEFDSVDINALKTLFASDIFKRILKSKLVKREMKFITEIPATRIDGSLNEKFAEEKVIVQGAVDICFEEEDGIVILDFKTDRTRNPEHFVSAYKEQLDIYAIACEKIFKKPVKQKIIYSFFMSKEIEIR